MIFYNLLKLFLSIHGTTAVQTQAIVNNINSMQVTAQQVAQAPELPQEILEHIVSCVPTANPKKLAPGLTPFLLNKQNSNFAQRLYTCFHARHTEFVEKIKATGLTGFDFENEGVNAISKKSNSYPLHAAAYEGNVDALKILLKYGAKVNARTDEGDTPLHLISTEELKTDDINLELLKSNNIKLIIPLLLSYGADINQPNYNGQTPLHKAAFGKNIDAAQSLINAQANLNALDNAGRTPLHSAVMNASNGKMIQLLLEAKALPSCVDRYGETPKDLAHHYGFTNNVQALEAYMAKAQA